jgi:hypothetical protein
MVLREQNLVAEPAGTACRERYNGKSGEIWAIRQNPT